MGNKNADMACVWNYVLTVHKILKIYMKFLSISLKWYFSSLVIYDAYNSYH